MRDTRSRLAALALLGLAAPARAECPHPFMPMKPGMTWVYTITAGEKYVYKQKRTLIVRVDRVDRVGEQEQATLTSVLRFVDHSGKRVEEAMPAQAFLCGPGGISSPRPPDFEPAPMESGAAAVTGRSRVRVAEKAGVVMPPPEALQKGFAWGDTFAFEVTPESGSFATSAAITRPQVGRRDTRKRVDAVEQVKTPLGVVDAIRVVEQEKVVSPTLPQPFTRTMVSWHARGIGMVRLVDGDNVTELTSFTPGQ